MQSPQHSLAHGTRSELDTNTDLGGGICPPCPAADLLGYCAGDALSGQLHFLSGGGEGVARSGGKVGFGHVVRRVHREWSGVDVVLLLPLLWRHGAVVLALDRAGTVAVTRPTAPR